jgi:hypothetical protein
MHWQGVRGAAETRTLHHTRFPFNFFNRSLSILKRAFLPDLPALSPHMRSVARSRTSVALVASLAVWGCDDSSVQRVDSKQREPTRPASVRMYRDTQQIPNEYEPVAVISPQGIALSAPDSLVFDAARAPAAKLGANGLVLRRVGNLRDVLALHVSNQPKRCTGVMMEVAPGDTACVRIGAPPPGAQPVPAGAVSVGAVPVPGGPPVPEAPGNK